ncbi:MAG TPA: LON peptidase substrate-binding domain-containing protein [Gammaproteobacteria bacterium]|nr:LON peptidase substrate-binding domain-containing protein [Gammaproteobacteria bacterium]
MSEIALPLFPLNTVLFPGGVLTLRIFEARYLDMVSACLKQDSGFGVCLIRSGAEVGQATDIHEIGTLAKITNWTQREDGLLGITCRGEQRFRIRSQALMPNRLLTGNVEMLADAPEQPVPSRLQMLVALFKELNERTNYHPPYKLQKATQANWLSYRLAELLPVDLPEKQMLLEIDDGLLRLDLITAILGSAGNHTTENIEE